MSSSFFNAEPFQFEAKKTYRFELNSAFEPEDILGENDAIDFRYIYTSEGFHMEVFFDQEKKVLKNFILNPVTFYPVVGPLHKTIPSVPKAILLMFAHPRSVHSYQVTLEH